MTSDQLTLIGSLGKEIWIDMILQNKFSFSDLLSFGLTCRYFGTILSSPAIQALKKAQRFVGTLATLSCAIQVIVYSHNGLLLGTGEDDQNARLWDVPTGKQLFKLCNDAAVYGLSFDPSDSCVATIGRNLLILWQVTTGVKLRTTVIENYSILRLLFSGDGKDLLLCTHQGPLLLMDTVLWTISRELIGHTSYAWEAAFSPDDTLIASCGHDCTVRLWDRASGTQIAELTGHYYYVNTVSFHPDGKSLVSASYDDSIRVWDVTTREKKQKKMTGHNNTVMAAHFTPDGKRVVSACQETPVFLWNSQNSQKIAEIPINARAIALHPDGVTFAYATKDHLGQAKLPPCEH